MNLERHQQLLLRARMDALSSQINPHFLFNTLNTVSALIRMDPDTAAAVVLKLSNILRRLLRKHETFVPLREELSFIDDYLDIEVARFGEDNLDIVKRDQRRHAGNLHPEHASATHGGKQLEARPCTQARRRPASACAPSIVTVVCISRSRTTVSGISEEKNAPRFTWKVSA